MKAAACIPVRRLYPLDIEEDTTMNDFWYGKKVLITGGDGFVASNLARTLIQKGAVVTVIVRHQRPITTNNLLGATSEEQPDIEVSSMIDFVEVQKICNRHQIDTIFHLAASAIVSDAANAPISTFQNNIIPTLNLLEAARINRIPRVLVASTDKSYGDHADADDHEPLPYIETYALRGLDVYSSSKVCTDVITQTYAYQFKIPAVVIRSCNIYGPGDLNFTRLIPRTTLRLLKGSAPVINAGNENVLREYIYIGDLVASYMFLAEKVEHIYSGEMPNHGKEIYGWNAFNVGTYNKVMYPRASDSPNIRSVVNVIQQLKDALCTDIEPVIIPKPANFIEIPDQYLDSSKLMQLGFEPKVDFDEGIRKTIDWYVSNREYLSRLGFSYLN